MEVSKINLNTIKAGAKNVAARGVEEATKLGKFAKETTISKAKEFDNYTGNKISRNLNKVNSNTVIGAGIGLAAVVLAAKCLKGIFKSVKNINMNK